MPVSLAWSSSVMAPSLSNLRIFDFLLTSAWDFQQCGTLTSVDSDEPLQPLFKLRNSKWCSVSSLIS